MSDVLCSMCTLQWASEQTHVGMTIETSKPTAVCGGTHFDSTIHSIIAQMKLPLLIASVHAALLLMQCDCQDEGMMQPQYTTAYYIIIQIGWTFMAIHTY